MRLVRPVDRRVVVGPAPAEHGSDLLDGGVLAVVEVHGAVAGGLFEVHERDVVLEGEAVVVRVVEDVVGCDLADLAHGRVGDRDVVPVDQQGDRVVALHTVRGSQRPVRGDQAGAAERARAGGPVALHGDQERVLVRWRDDVAADDLRRAVPDQNNANKPTNSDSR
eukprot:COSAG02_NODE_720_length_18054_cov_23.121192_4_plen_166_part_00